jgi:RNA polymerase sigma-70 factor (ECF subfamily)
MTFSQSKNPESAGSTSSSLLSRAKAADAQAWERLSRLYGPLVYRWARQAGMQPNDAADIVQEVFETLSRRLEAFRNRNSSDSFRGWLWTITRNKIRDFFRRLKGRDQAAGGTDAKQRLNQLPDRPAALTSEQGSCEASQLRSRALELVRGDFEPQTWRAFWRVVIDGDAPADVADDLGLSVWAVYKARSRVLQRLREELEGLVD